MDLGEKPVKSCAIKVHLANIINRKSHVTLVVPELCSGLTIKTTVTKKIGLNEQHVKDTELFVSVRDSFRTLTNSDENDGSNLFHVLDMDSPGQFVNLRFCEFYLYWNETLPPMLEKSINISEFRSRASIEEKLVSVVNTKLSNSHVLRNGSLKTANLIRTGISAPANNNQQKTHNQTRNHLLEGSAKPEKKILNRANSSLVHSLKNNSEKTERNPNKEGNAFGNNNSSDIKRRPSLSSVKAQIKSSNIERHLEVLKDELKVIPGKEEVLNSPCSSYSSSSLELKHNLSSSMPVLNKVRMKDLNAVQNKKNLLMGTRVSSKTTTSDVHHHECDSTVSEKLSTSRRQLPQVTISEEVVEEKRYLLSKKLEKRLIRRATMNESNTSKKSVHKTQSLLGWKEKFKSYNEDSDDSRSLASQEVAEILADAGPMGVVESDYEEHGSTGRDDEDESLRSEDLRSAGKNVFLSLFDSMTSDQLEEEASDGELKASEESSGCLNLQACSEADTSSKFSHLKPERRHDFCKNLPQKVEFQSTKSSFTLYSQVRHDRQSESIGSRLTLFDLLKPGVLKLYPVSVDLVEKRTNNVNKRKVLPFKVFNDVIKLKSPSCDVRNVRSNKLEELTKTFDALKIGSFNEEGHSTRLKSKLFMESAYRPGDLLIEVNNVNVLGFTESQFADLESSVLSKCDAVRMVVARMGDS